MFLEIYFWIYLFSFKKRIKNYCFFFIYIIKMSLKEKDLGVSSVV